MAAATPPEATTGKSWKETSTALLLTLLVLAEVNHAFEQNMVAIALPTLYKVFGDPFAVGWSLTAYALVAAATAATAGRLGDVVGRKQVLVGALVVGFIGSLIVVLVPTLPGLIAGRAVQGVTGAILGLAFGIIREKMGTHRSGTAIGLLAGTALIGATFASTLSGLLVDSFGWHSLFVVSTGLALLSVILCAALLPSTERRGSLRDVDIAGGTFLAIGVTLILLGLTFVRRQGWTSPIVLGCLIVGVVVIVGWVVYELRVQTPAVDLRSLRDPRVAIAHLAMFFAATGLFSAAIVTSVVFQAPTATGIGLGLTALGAALVIAPGTLFGGVIFSPLAGRMSKNKGGGGAMLVGSLIIFVGYTALVFGGTAPPVLVTGVLMGLIGIAFIYAAIPNLLLPAVPSERTSEAANLNQVMKSVGSAVGPLVFSAFLAANLEPINGTPMPSQTSYLHSFIFMSLSGLVLVVLSLLAIGFERKRRSQLKRNPVAEDVEVEVATESAG